MDPVRGGACTAGGAAAAFSATAADKARAEEHTTTDAADRAVARRARGAARGAVALAHARGGASVRRTGKAARILRRRRARSQDQERRGGNAHVVRRRDAKAAGARHFCELVDDANRNFGRD